MTRPKSEASILAEEWFNAQDWHSCNGVSLGPYIRRAFTNGYRAGLEAAARKADAHHAGPSDCEGGLECAISIAHEIRKSIRSLDGGEDKG